MGFIIYLYIDAKNCWQIYGLIHKNLQSNCKIIVTFDGLFIGKKGNFKPRIDVFVPQDREFKKENYRFNKVTIRHTNNRKSSL